MWYYWSRFDKLTVEDSILDDLRTPVCDGPETKLRAIVPRAARQEILELAHESRVGGHFGVQKTVAKLRQKFHWLKFAKDVKYWSENCQTCNRHETSQRNRGALTLIYTGAPFERVTMDIVGPLPCKQRGNRYILSVVDHFTKHVEAYVLPDQEAVSISRVFLNEFISRFGVPYIIHPFQAANFESHMFKELFQLLNIK